MNNTIKEILKEFEKSKEDFLCNAIATTTPDPTKDDNEFYEPIRLFLLSSIKKVVENVPMVGYIPGTLPYVIIEQWKSAILKEIEKEI